VYLKSITLKGFKSFPHRTRLEFGPGVSVIVGPNGSGKSNVTDAVLWALGEQSPVAVRGQSMQDVIFAGAPGRQASRAAEVELVLEDSAGALGLGTPEVSIVRRLDRDGEGEYRLAGARCRLVDVIEVLSDTGLGKEMHSVISQGRVESLVTSKPRERRLLIEEAAGLGKHRKRRRRAQLKLVRTQDNLDRALDIEREARSRLRPLKRQAEAAELHARLERQTLEAQWELSRDALRAQLEETTAAEASAAEARAKREAVERELGEIARRREAAEEALSGRSAFREQLSRRTFVAQSAAARVSDRVESVRASAAAVTARLERSRERLDALGRGGVEQEPDDRATQRIAGLEASLAALERERERELAEQLAEFEHQRAAAVETVAALSGRADELAGARRQADAIVERAGATVRDGERAVEKARREAARIGAELAAVNQFLRGQQGPPGHAPGGATVLADQLEVDAGYELAVAAALDGRLKAALVDDPAGASALLDRAGADGGRALVVPAHDPSPAAGADAPSAGAERLADRLRGPDPALRLARTLLRDAWVIDALDSIPEAFSGIAVTRGGRVWSAPTGELRQAPAVGEERVLAERNRRDQLIGATEAAAQAELETNRRLERATEEHRATEAERERAIAAHRAAVSERDEAAEGERRIAAVLERRRSAPDEGPNEGRRVRLGAELDAERERLERARRARTERAEAIERLTRSIAAHESVLEAAGGLTGSLERAAEAIAGTQRAFEAALEADRQAGEQVAADLRVCAQQEAALQARLHSESESLTNTEVSLQRARDRVTETRVELDALAARLELEAAPASEPLGEEERDGLRSRLERLGRRREQLGPVNPLAQEEYAEALEHVEELETQREDLETALRELEKLISDTDRQIRETFEQTFAAAARNFEDVAGRLFPGGHGRLRLIAENEGPARVLGGEQAGEGGPADEEEADDPTAGEDEPEQDLGVEIEINPAGKEMKRLSLLSGGEKSMTALAFLFAVFLARPCPFYILDEVEAALDETNIDRFLGLLGAYSEHAQFIVVTHQRRTMEAADFLYGVSMGGDGVSKVISQRLGREREAAA
jgi:chromosome segregation protein